MTIDFDQFSDGSARKAERLTERHKRIIVDNCDAFENKKILDIAASNGRWTYAALFAGANYVESIEGRSERAKDAIKFLNDNNFSEKYTANVGDMYDFLYENKSKTFDTVLCLGIYYHVMDHYHFLKLMARLNPQTIIIDSGFVRSFKNIVHIQNEDPESHLNALSIYPGQKSEIVGSVSLGLMIQMAWNLGYSCRPNIWNPKDIKNPSCVQDYMIGKRYTVRLEKMDNFTDPDWQKYWKPALECLKGDFVRLFDRETHNEQVDDRARQPNEAAEFSII
jgi:hypothetical protein